LRPGGLRVLQGLTTILAAIAAFFLSLQPVRAAEGTPVTLSRVGDARSGSLLMKTQDGSYAQAPRLGVDARLTSLVAVDRTPSRPDGAPLKVSELPLNLPVGRDFAKVSGERRAGSGEARVQLALANRSPVATAPSAIVLPKTATDAELKMIAGALLLLASLILFAFNRRRAWSA
jgi:LPXTG-motif cell wall-anchored protein